MPLRNTRPIIIPPGIDEGYANGEISFKGADREAVKLALQQAKSEDDFAKGCKKAGVVGAEKYAKLLFQQTMAMRKISQ